MNMQRMKNIKICQLFSIVFFIVILLFSYNLVWEKEKKLSSKTPPKGDLYNDLNMSFQLIPAGSFLQGSTELETPLGRDSDEGPQRKVTISHPFYLQTTPVTQEQWLRLMPQNPSRFKGSLQHPIDSVSWNDAQEYIKKLNARKKGIYRLPTEAEFEYATRAGTTTPWYFGETAHEIDKYEWTQCNGTRPVATKFPNPWGLYDMAGNIEQYCSDWYSGSYPLGDAIDPKGYNKSPWKAIRGGCWAGPAKWSRSAERHASNKEELGNGAYGFRLVWEPPEINLP